MDYYTEFRLSAFVIVLLIFSILEYLYPKRPLVISRKSRWLINYSLILISNAIIRLIIPFTLIGVSIYATNNNIGLFNNINISKISIYAISFIALDLLIYIQHIAFHHIPFLWRFHKIHHIDQEIDLSTGLRFHPIEILFSIFIKASAILLLGLPIISVIIFEIILNAMSMFSHCNLKLPSYIDKFIRLIFVTPDMHRVHHSTDMNETNSNFGFNFSFWDRIFRTYKEAPKKGHSHMNIGLTQYRNQRETSLIKMLLLPFKKN